MGRLEKSIEQRRKYQRDKYREMWANDPEYRAKKKARDKARRLKNIEQERERGRARYYANRDRRIEQRVEWARKNRERQREYNRKFYNDNKERLREIIYAARFQREPTRGLHTALLRFKQGDITLDQLIESFGERIILLNERLEKQSARCGDKALRSGESADSSSMRESDNTCDEDKAGFDEVRKRNTIE